MRISDWSSDVCSSDLLAPLTRTPGIQRLRVLDDRGRTLTEWRSPAADPAPILTGIFFPRPFGLTVRRNGSAIGTIEVWGNSTALTDYIRLGLFAGLVWLLITAIGTITQIGRPHVCTH